MIARSEPWPLTDIMMVVALVFLLSALGYKALTMYAISPVFVPQPRQLILFDAETALDSSSPCAHTLVAPSVERHVLIGPSPLEPRVVELWYKCDSEDDHAFIWSVPSSR
jgi:hypothetical protein